MGKWFLDFAHDEEQSKIESDVKHLFNMKLERFDSSMKNLEIAIEKYNKTNKFKLSEKFRWRDIALDKYKESCSYLVEMKNIAKQATDPEIMKIVMDSGLKLKKIADNLPGGGPKKRIKTTNLKELKIEQRLLEPDPDKIFFEKKLISKIKSEISDSNKWIEIAVRSIKNKTFLDELKEFRDILKDIETSCNVLNKNSNYFLFRENFIHYYSEAIKHLQNMLEIANSLNKIELGTSIKYSKEKFIKIYEKIMSLGYQT